MAQLTYTGGTISYKDPNTGSDDTSLGFSTSRMNRWLKLANASVVTKIFQYVPIYILNIGNPTWIGVSERVVQYNFLTNNNFTLDIFKVLQQLVGLNCCICIRWNTCKGYVRRYKLNTGVGEVVYAPLYNGQLIQKNFSIEIWSAINQTNSVITNEIDIITSVFDPQQDSFDPTTNEVNAPTKYSDSVATATDFGALNENAIASPDLTNNLFWFDPNTNVNVTGANVNTWTDRNNGVVLTAGAAKPTWTAGNGYLAFAGAEVLSNNITNNPLYTQYIIVNLTTPEAAKHILSLTTTIASICGLLSGSGGMLAILTSNPTFPQNITFSNFLLIEMTLGGSINVYDLTSGESLQFNSSVSVPAIVNTTNVAIGDSAGTVLGFKVSDYLGYNSLQTSIQRVQTLQYLFDKYSNVKFNIPILFAQDVSGNNNICLPQESLANFNFGNTQDQLNSPTQGGGITIINQGGGSGGGSSNLFAGNYGGGIPPFAPNAELAMALDTTTGRNWEWYSNSWH